MIKTKDRFSNIIRRLGFDKRPDGISFELDYKSGGRDGYLCVCAENKFLLIYVDRNYTSQPIFNIYVNPSVFDEWTIPKGIKINPNEKQHIIETLYNWIRQNPEFDSKKIQTELENICCPVRLPASINA